MNIAMRKPMTLAEFLDWEERQELRHEFDGARVFSMTGGTAAHSLIQTNLAVAVGGRLRGKPCRFYNNDLKFLTAESTVRYPDGQVVCAPVDPKAKWVENPTVVFEVLSPSTTKIDRIDKAREYEATPSVQHYVMLEQGAAAAVVYNRIGDAWTHAILPESAVLALPVIGLEFPLAELYEGLNFDAAGDETEPA